MKYITKEQLDKATNLEDLSATEGHAINLVMNKIKSHLEKVYKISATLHKGNPIVDKKDNYDILGYKMDEVTLSEKYTRYISDEKILRTQMTAVMPNQLKEYSKELKNNPDKEKLWVCPGLVYRRDVIDRTHVGEPHQMDVWYIKKGQTTREDLISLVENILKPIEEVLGQKLQYRANETSHHYTEDGIEVEILYKGKWLEILECGLAGRKLLDTCGIDSSVYGGLALGMGLDRLVMIAKSIEDIRLLRSQDERIKKQLSNLNKYKNVSNQPAIKRDLSLAIDEGYSLEELCEQVYDLMGDEADMVEEVVLREATPYDNLPEVARERLGIKKGQENWLVRIILRHPSRSVPTEEANEVYKRLYSELHQTEGGYI